MAVGILDLKTKFIKYTELVPINVLSIDDVIDIYKQVDANKYITYLEGEKLPLNRKVY